jgi:hypothetical protein
MLDPRYISGSCFIFIGLVFIITVIRILATHPVNRVFILAPFVTSEGQKFILRGCYTVLMIGCLAVADGSAKLFYAMNLSRETMDTLGTIVAGLSVIAAGCVIVAAWRVWRRG